MAEPDLDVDAIQELVRLSDETGGTLFSAMVAAFLEHELPSAVDQIRAGIAGADQRAVAEAAHRLRGSAAVLGAASLAAVCDRLLGRASEPSEKSPRDLLADLEAEAASAGAALADLARTSGLEQLVHPPGGQRESGLMHGGVVEPASQLSARRVERPRRVRGQH
jgi:HPt (histidine-containing phosphotransfer) domain-containing protein